MGRLKQNNKGFTMIELMIYLSMISVLVLVFNSFIVDVVHQSSRTVWAKTVEQDSRFILARIGQEIKTADTAAASSDRLDITRGADNIIIAFDSVGQSINYTINGVTEKLSGDSIIVNNLAFSLQGNMIDVVLDLENKNTGDSTTHPYALHSTFSAQPRNGVY